MRFSKQLLVGFVLIAGLTGCGKVPVNSRSTSAGSTNYIGAEAVLVESAETKERRELRAEAVRLLNGAQYDKIEQRAGQLRIGKQAYPDGNSKLNEFCSALSNLPDHASEGRWTNNLAHLRSWLQAKPGSITAQVALARGLIAYGAKARGGAAGREVSKLGLLLFRERLAEAREILMKGEKMQTLCPLWYTSMLQLAVEEGASRDFIDQVFAAAARLEPNFAAPCVIMASHLSPRSHGKKGEMEQFAQSEANKRGGDAGDILYARIVWNLQNGRSFTNIFDETKISWDRTKKGFQALQKTFPDSFAVKSALCYLAGLAGDRPAMKDLFSQLEGKVELSVWKEKKRFITDRQWAFAN